MPGGPKQFTVRLVLETRTLNVRGEAQVFSAVSGKGHNSGWSRIQKGLEALGFRLTFDTAATATDTGVTNGLIRSSSYSSRRSTAVSG